MNLDSVLDMERKRYSRMRTNLRTREPVSASAPTQISHTETPRMTSAETPSTHAHHSDEVLGVLKQRAAEDEREVGAVPALLLLLLTRHHHHLGRRMLHLQQHVSLLSPTPHVCQHQLEHKATRWGSLSPTLHMANTLEFCVAHTVRDCGFQSPTLVLLWVGVSETITSFTPQFRK